MLCFFALLGPHVPPRSELPQRRRPRKVTKLPYQDQRGVGGNSGILRGSSGFGGEYSGPKPRPKPKLEPKPRLDARPEAGSQNHLSPQAGTPCCLASAFCTSAFRWGTSGNPLGNPPFPPLPLARAAPSPARPRSPPSPINSDFYERQFSFNSNGVSMPFHSHY